MCCVERAGIENEIIHNHTGWVYAGTGSHAMGTTASNEPRQAPVFEGTGKPEHPLPPTCPLGYTGDGFYGEREAPGHQLDRGESLQSRLDEKVTERDSASNEKEGLRRRRLPLSPQPAHKQQPTNSAWVSTNTARPPLLRWDAADSTVCTLCLVAVLLWVYQTSANKK